MGSVSGVRRWVGVACVGLAGLGWVPQAAAKSVALLVGISHYGLLKNANLEGPEHDVAALRDVLTRRWGFAPSDVVTLVNEEATRDDILAELHRLMKRTQPGDEVLVYFSGHGTSGLDAAGGANLPQELASGTGAFLPADFAWGDAESSARGMLIGRRDLRPIFSELEQERRSLVVLADACYSGESVRGPGEPPQPGDLLPNRWLPMPTGLKIARNLQLSTTSTRPEPYPYRSTAYLAAAAQGEPAKDIPARFIRNFPTLDGRPHGAMTDALLRVLEGQWPADFNRDGWLDLNELHRSVSEYMDGRSYNQTPQRLPNVYQDNTGLGGRRLFGVQGQARKPESGMQTRDLRVALPSSLEQQQAQIRALGGIDPVLAGATPTDLSIVDSGDALEFWSASAEKVATVKRGQPTAVLALLQQMAWVHRIQQLAKTYRSGAMPAEVTPTDSGGRFLYGTKIAYVMRPEQPSYLLLLTVSSAGQATLLYPRNTQEAGPIPGGKRVMIPDEDIGAGFSVGEPPGMDMQLIFAFSSPVPELSEWAGRMVGVDMGDSRLKRLERLLAERQGQFSFSSHRTWAVPPLPATSNAIVLPR